MTAYLLRWAVIDGRGAHSDTPTVAELEADGWVVVGGDPRYPRSVLMQKFLPDTISETIPSN